MKRRKFVALLGSAVVWPLAAGAQQTDLVAIALISLDGGKVAIFAANIAGARMTLATYGLPRRNSSR